MPRIAVGISYRRHRYNTVPLSRELPCITHTLTLLNLLYLDYPASKGHDRFQVYPIPEPDRGVGAVKGYSRPHHVEVIREIVGNYSSAVGYMDILRGKPHRPDFPDYIRKSTDLLIHEPPVLAVGCCKVGENPFNLYVIQFLESSKKLLYIARQDPKPPHPCINLYMHRDSLSSLSSLIGNLQGGIY